MSSDGRQVTTLELVNTVPMVSIRDESTCFEVFSSELDYVCRTFRRLGVGSANVEDLAHEVFLVLARKWSGFDRTRPLRPYLFGIAYRIAKAHRRRSTRPPRFENVEIADPSAQPDAQLEAERARALVLSALERLPLARRAVLVMHDIDEVPMRDVTRALGIPLFTGYSRLRKARVEFASAVRAIHGGNDE